MFLFGNIRKKWKYPTGIDTFLWGKLLVDGKNACFLSSVSPARCEKRQMEQKRFDEIEEGLSAPT